jgi:hypothetical protein
MNRIVEAICRYKKNRDHIVGIETDFRNYRISIYLGDGSVRVHSDLAVCEAQFRARWERARQMFHQIHWHLPHEAMPDWMTAVHTNSPEN